MRVSFQVCAAAVAASLTAVQPAIADLRLDDMIGHWRLDATSGGAAIDEVNGNDGTWQNGEDTNLTWIAGRIGLAALLTGEAGPSQINHFSIPEIAQLADPDATGWTISAWINPGMQTGGYNGIFNSRTVNGGGSWGLALEGSGPYHTDNRMGGGGLDTPDSIEADGSWYHVANTWDSATGARSAYINGALAANDIENAVNITVGGAWEIGFDPCCSDRDFTGAIDDVALWKVPLADADIAEIYNNGLAGRSADGDPGIIAGDVNGDLLVDDDDFQVIRNNFYNSVTMRNEGDLNNDGIVDFADFDQWKTASQDFAPTADAVPEPTSAWLLLGAIVAIAIIGYRGPARLAATALCRFDIRASS